MQGWWREKESFVSCFLFSRERKYFAPRSRTNLKLLWPEDALLLVLAATFRPASEYKVKKQMDSKEHEVKDLREKALGLGWRKKTENILLPTKKYIYNRYIIEEKGRLRQAKKMFRGWQKLICQNIGGAIFLPFHFEPESTRKFAFRGRSKGTLVRETRSHFYEIFVC